MEAGLITRRRVLAWIAGVLAPVTSLPRIRSRPMERQLTHGPENRDLDNNINFSPDGEWLVFDCRDESGIPGNRRLGRAHVRTGKTQLIYETPAERRGVGAASFLNDREVIAIHALESGIPYDFTVRGGMILAADGSGRRGWLDSRDVTPPFTPGALRGGTHKHEPDSTGEWIGFTYNDHVMKARGSDLRNVGVSRRGMRVAVEPDAAGQNFTGESFSVLLTACVENPAPGSDQYRRAEGDCWVVSKPPRARRARAFRGAVCVLENGEARFYGDVFLVEVPEEITVPGPLGPLEGTPEQYPAPPQGAIVRRLTRTAENPDLRLRGVSGHLRASGDGRWIACIAKARRGDSVEDQVFAVSAADGEMRRLSDIPGGVTGDPRFSPDSRFVVAAAPDGSFYRVSAEDRDWGASRRIAPPHPSPASNLVVSPDSHLAAYNRRVDGFLQIFLAETDR